jgi:hypothetical protein
MKNSVVDPDAISLKMVELLVNPIFLEEYIKWIGTLRDSAYFEDLKDWICTLSKDEYDEMASSASSFDLDFCKKCQYFCLEIQFKYLQFCMESYGSLLTQDKSLDFYYQNIIAYEKQHEDAIQEYEVADLEIPDSQVEISTELYEGLPLDIVPINVSEGFQEYTKLFPDVDAKKEVSIEQIVALSSGNLELDDIKQETIIVERCHFHFSGQEELFVHVIQDPFSFLLESSEEMSLTVFMFKGISFKW